jgi:glycyl-tRNA synthetase beta chain
MLMEKDLPLALDALVQKRWACSRRRSRHRRPAHRLHLRPPRRRLREQGYSAQEVDAVLALRPQRLGDVAKRLAAVRAFAALPEAPRWPPPTSASATS